MRDTINKMKKLDKLTKFDWVIFLFLIFFSYFTLQQWDLLHTAGSSAAYLNGHFFDFYEYNQQYVKVNNYFPSSYILFAIWNIPLKLFGMFNVPTLNPTIPMIMWYKLLPTLFYFGCGILFKKICLLLGMGKEKAQIGTFVFLTTPIAFFSQFIFGQTDSFTLFFVLLGIVFWLRNKPKDLYYFALCFGIACTFKYFPVFLFAPVLLLKQKKYVEIIKSVLLFFSPLVIETIPYLHSEAFQSGVFGFEANGYLSNTTFATTMWPLSILILCWIVVCAVAFFVSPSVKDQYETDVNKWFIFLTTIVCYLLFGLQTWHPQWLLFMTPFLVLGMLAHKNGNIFAVIDIMLMLMFTIITVNNWPNHVDQQLFGYGILRRLLVDRYNVNLTMRQLFIFKDTKILFSFFSGLLLVSSIFKHPIFLRNDVKTIQDNFLHHIRARMLIGINIFIIPALICLISMLNGNKVLVDFSPSTNVGSFIGQENIGVTNNQRFVAQYWVASENAVINSLGFFAGNYARKNEGILKITIYDNQKETEISNTIINLRKIRDNEWQQFQLNPAKIEKGQAYRVEFDVLGKTEKDAITFYKAPLKKDFITNYYAIIDKHRQVFNLCIYLAGTF